MDQSKIVKFLSLWVINSVLLLLCSAILKSGIVLGNDKVNGSLAAVFSGLFLTLTPFIAHLILGKYIYKIRDLRIESVFLIAVNSVVIWVIKRFALTTGLGVSNILLVGFLAVLATFTYMMTNRYVGDLLNKK